MGALVFVGSGILALLIMYFFMRVLRLVVPRFIELHKRIIIFTVGTIFVTFNFLYFTNVIPPIPLSLKDVGIYHGVVRFDNGDYRLTYEKQKWWEFWQKSDDIFHAEEGDNIFCFASVFAPTRLETDIYHHWEYYSEERGEWIEHARLSYAISGGRGSGFRGYTLIRSFEEGTWRCRVETARGQVLGTEKFTVEKGPHGELITRIE